MAQRILVPLDQSRVAEAIVPLVADLARGAGATVRLLTVVPTPRAAASKEQRMVGYADQEMDRLEREGLDYLGTIEARLGDAAVTSVVRFGDAAEEVLREAEGFGADLIAVSTLGRSAVSRLTMGTVAEAIFRTARTAVVLYHTAPASAR